MLNSMQRDIIRTGYHAAEKTGDVEALRQRVQKLAKDFHVSEDEIRNVAVGIPTAASPSVNQVSAAREAAKHRGRREWTTKEVQQLLQLRGEGKGPAEIAKVLGYDVRRVQSKLHNLKKDSTQAQPAGEARGTPEPVGAAPALEAKKEEPAPQQPAPDPAPAGPQEASPIAPSEISEEVLAPDEYYALRAKLAEPEVPGINLAKEGLNLIDHFELAYPVKVKRLQANLSAGWMTFSFDDGEYRYTVSLRARSREASP